ncbi:MAG TPA: ATP-binding protein [Patescibacteria group bacterium]|nr:ATP-binding protein [Patescibacteria group bacterium]
MKRSFLVLALVIQILGLFVFENMRTLFKSLEKNEIAAIIAQSDLQAELHIQKTLLHVPRPGREKYFDQILPLPRAENSKQVTLAGKQRLLQIKKPLGDGSGLLFKRTIRSPQLDQFAALKKVLSGLIFFLGIFIAASGIYLMVLLRKKGPEKSLGAGSPFQDYLVEMKNTQLELQNLVAEQNRVTSQKEELNKSIINTVHLGVIFISAGAKIEIFNPAAQKLFNRSFAGAKNNSLATVLQEHPKLTAFIQAGEKKISAEIESGPFIFYVDVVPISDSGRLVLVRDVSAERKKEKIQRQNANLMMLGEMAAALAHEIRNSLGVILGYSKAMRTEPEKTRKIVREINFLSEMMESFLQFARPVEKISRKKTDVAKLIATAAATQEMAVDLPQRTLHLKSDPLLLNVIFSNLVLNAKQAGAMSLKVEFSDAATPSLTFADDGPGIAAANTEKIWLPFFSTRDKGTGMGLATVKKLVSALNGDIQLLEKEGKGATFRIVFYT